jgi:hypothetical protein
MVACLTEVERLTLPEWLVGFDSLNEFVGQQTMEGGRWMWILLEYAVDGCCWRVLLEQHLWIYSGLTISHDHGRFPYPPQPSHELRMEVWNEIGCDNFLIWRSPPILCLVLWTKSVA